jgi:hypothetical protein
MTDHKQIYRSILIDELTAAARPDTLVLARDLVKAGVPRQWAETVSRESLRITDEASAVMAADDLAERIAAARVDTDTDDPIELAKFVPRL